MSYLLILSSCITYKRFLALWALLGLVVTHSWFTSNYRIPVDIAWGIVALFIFIFSLLINRYAFHFKISWYAVLMALYFFTAAVSGIINHSEWLWGHLTKIAIPIGFGLFFIYAFSKNDLKMVLYALSFFGLMDLFFSFCIFTLDLLDVKTAFPISGFITDRNGFGRYLSIINSFFLIEFLLEKNKSRKFTFFMLLLLIFFGILIQYSRSGYLVYFISSALIIFLLGTKKIKRLSLAVFPFVAALFTVFTMHRVHSDNMLVANYSDLSRIYMLKSGIKMIQSHPLRGIGYGMTPNEFQEYADKSFPGLLDVCTIHNWFVAVWAEMGIAGLLVFCALNFGLMYHSLRRFFTSGPLDGKYPLFSFCALLILMIDGLFLPNYDYESIYWIIIAIGVISLERVTTPANHDRPSNRLSLLQKPCLDNAL